MMSNYNFVTFGNNVAIINTTPHSVTIQENSVSRKEINYEKIYHYCHHYGSYLYHYNS